MIARPYIVGNILLLPCAVKSYAVPPVSARFIRKISDFVGISSVHVAPFIAAVVFVAGFFSFGLGGLVYLRFESDLRIAVDQVRLATLSTVQARFSGLFSNQGALSAKEWVQLGSAQGHCRLSVQVWALERFIAKSGCRGCGNPPAFGIHGRLCAYLREEASLMPHGRTTRGWRRGPGTLLGASSAAPRRFFGYRNIRQFPRQ